MHAIDKRPICKNLYDMHGFSLRKIAMIVSVSHTTVRRWVALTDSEMFLSKYSQVHRKRLKSGTPVVEALRGILKSNPLSILEDIQDKLYQLFSFRISKSFLSSILRHKCGVTRKKARFYGKSHDYDLSVHEFIRKKDQYLSEHRHFMSLDETSFSRKGKDVYGFSPKGKQIKIQRPWKSLTSKSCLACLDQKGVLQYHIIDGSYTKEKMIDALQNLHIQKHSVILMDNLAVHRSADVQKILQEKQLDVLFIPPYSPWFNPIEYAFSLVKREFYKHGKIQESLDRTVSKSMILRNIFSSVMSRRH